MTFPNFAQPGPRPAPPLAAPPLAAPQVVAPQAVAQAPGGGNGEDTGHPAVDAVLRSLANAARLAPAEQIAEYEAAHQVLQETLASIDR
ncbi:hypothetical protein ACQP2E_28560 [Actinoplanes sp. CA-015351]|uniref:hypothetical protein n=1 Tax=Actinoplanes sp. CA-015351 TaxID=3239897 RepID=UPI003D96A8FE